MHALSLDVTAAPEAGRRVRLAAEVGYGELAVVRCEPADGTALARTVAVETPAGGRVVVGGTDVAALPPPERRIGYVPAGGGLLPHLTLRRNITYGLRLRSRGIAGRFVPRRVDQAAEALGLTLVLDLRPHEVTEDERLRAAFARAAVLLPEVLLVDLPRGAVDDGTGEPGEPPRLAELAKAASLSDRFEVAALVFTADPEVADQAAAPLTVEVGAGA